MNIRKIGALGVILGVLVLPAAGCGESTTGPNLNEDDMRPGYPLLAAGSGISLEAEAEAFLPGAQVILRLSNKSTEQVGHNMCFHALERRDGDAWVTAPELGDRICTLVLFMLDPGNSATYPTALPSNLSAGEYRFRVALSIPQAEHRDVATDGFQVGG